MKKDPFKEYIRESEPDKASKSYVWSTAIGLQAVDGLKPSKYLIETAFSFSPNEYISIHRKLFHDIYKCARQSELYKPAKRYS